MPTNIQRFPWRVWLLCLLTFACFYQSEQNSNITTRLGLTLSIIDRHELIIDPFAPNTVDKAQVGDHVYADKAPGMSLLALPLAAITRPLLDLPADLVRPPDLKLYLPDYVKLLYLLTMTLVSGATATATAFMYRWCRLRGSSVAASAFACAAFAFGTPMMWWSTSFFGHANASAFLLLGFAFLSESLSSIPSRPGDEAHPDHVRAKRAILGGLFLGLSFMTEFTAGPAVAIIAIVCGAEALLQRTPWPRVIPTFLFSAVGLVGPMLAVGIYNAMAFGSPLHLGYASVNDFPGMQKGFFGVSLPDLHVARLLLIGQYRGLLFLAPIVALAPFAIVVALRRPQWRAVSIAAALVFLWYLMMNAGYYYWWGGYSTGPRHLTPGLSLLLIPFAQLWDRLFPLLRWPALVLLAASVFIAVTLASLQIASPEWTWQPFADVWLPMIKRHNFPRLLSNAVGINGLWGFLPVVLVWLLCGLPFLRALFASALAAPAKAP